MNCNTTHYRANSSSVPGDPTHKSYYSVVIAVAKRAREITQEAEDNNEIIVEKPVDLAVQDFVDEKYKIIEPDEIDG